jgi:hypothetical protein
MASQQQLPILTQSEQDNAKKAFEKYDEDHSGSIDIVSAHALFPCPPLPGLDFIHLTND